MESNRKVDIAIFFEGGPNNGMVIYDVDYEDMTYSLSTYYSDNFFKFNQFNSDLKEDEELIVNLSQIQFIRIKDKGKR